MIELLFWCALCNQTVFASPTNANVEAGVTQAQFRGLRTPRVSGLFLAEISALAVAKTADAITTRQVLSASGSERNSWLYGSHPSPGHQAAVNAGVFAGQAAALYFTEKSRHAWIRWTGRAVIAGVVIDHARVAACNAALPARPEVLVNCPR